MVKKKKFNRPKYKTLFTSAAIAMILTNISVEEVQAAEGTLASQREIEFENVEATAQEDKEVILTNQNELQVSEKVVEKAQENNAAIDSAMTDMDDSNISSNGETTPTALSDPRSETKNAETTLDQSMEDELFLGGDVTAPQVIDADEEVMEEFDKLKENVQKTILPATEIEESLADSGIINQIVLIDDSTGEEIAKKTITGEVYTERLKEFIVNLNDHYSIDIDLISTEIINSSKK